MPYCGNCGLNVRQSDLSKTSDWYCSRCLNNWKRSSGYNYKNAKKSSGLGDEPLIKFLGFAFFYIMPIVVLAVFFGHWAYQESYWETLFPLSVETIFPPAVGVLIFMWAFLSSGVLAMLFRAFLAMTSFALIMEYLNLINIILLMRD